MYVPVMPVSAYTALAFVFVFIQISWWWWWWTVSLHHPATVGPMHSRLMQYGKTGDEYKDYRTDTSNTAVNTERMTRSGPVSR